MEKQESINGATEIADLMAKVLSPSESSDKEVLNIVAEYSLQLNPLQQMVLNKLAIIACDERIPEIERKKIEMFIPLYMKTKRFHDSLPFIGRTIDALSLRKFWSMDSMKGQIIQQK